MTSWTETIPTLDTPEAARTLLDDLAKSHDWVSVFWDRGWGDGGQTAEISIIVDGNGQEPVAWLTSDVYRTLVADKTVAANSLKTFKARRVHDYKTPSPAEPEVSANDVAETVVRDLLAAHPDWPIHVEFYRGLNPDSRTPRVMHEVAETPACGRDWFVRILPGCSDMRISAAGVYERFFGADLLGDVATLCYPTAGDDVDVAALLGDGFRAELQAAVEAKLAEIEAAR